jgi:hypothetical protein
MKTEIISICVVLLSLLALSNSTLAEWTEPIPVTEVNTELHETSPFLSYDGLTLYFVKGDGGYKIYSATRDEPFGPFTSVELALSSSHHVYGPWVSPDNLRMYYHEELPSGWQLKMSERASVDDPWPQGTNVSEISSLGKIHSPKLTPDELTIFFGSPDIPGGLGGYDIWMASRPDTSSPFGDVRNLTEINTDSHDSGPFISPDGLTLYFSSNRNGTTQLFKAIRNSLSEPFGNLEHLSFFDTPEGHSYCPCVSSDGEALYFVRVLTDEYGDIYVSYSISEEPAEWTEPAPLTEVNTELHETSPFLSYDGLTLYFCRYDDLYRIYSASRDEPLGPFTSVGLVLSSSNHVYGPWVSPDNLRMYYHEELPSGWLLKMSERASVDDPWPQGTNVSEISSLGKIHSPKLTPDELTIFFGSPDIPGGLGGYDIWMASRPDTSSPFGNVRNLTEINTGSHESGPFISPDGLMLYFSSDRNGTTQLFKAVRNSLSEPFGSLEHLSIFDTPGGHSYRPCVSSDGGAFYFARFLPDEDADIYVSYRIEEPYELAILHIEKAIEKKNEAITKIDAAMNEEIQAYEALDELLLSGEYGDLSKKDIIKAKREVLTALRRQKICRTVLHSSIRRLENALILLDQEVEPQSWPDDINEHIIQADINVDGKVDLRDMALLMDSWLGSYE